MTEENKQSSKPTTPRPNRTELLNHLQAIFNEAREDRRSYRALRAAFSTAVGVATMLQNNIFNSIQGTSDALTSAAMLVSFIGTGLVANYIAHTRIAVLTRIGRMADERIKKVIQSQNDTFEAKEFVTYLEVFKLAEQRSPESDNGTGNSEKPKKTNKSKETILVGVSLTVTFLIASSSIAWQWKNPREAQHVIIDKVTTQQHVIVDSMPRLDKKNKSSCPLNARINKDGNIILEMDCEKPEQVR
jgi:hypothetical protein